MSQKNLICHVYTLVTTETINMDSLACNNVDYTPGVVGNGCGHHRTDSGQYQCRANINSLSGACN